MVNQLLACFHSHTYWPVPPPPTPSASDFAGFAKSASLIPTRPSHMSPFASLPQSKQVSRFLVSSPEVFVKMKGTGWQLGRASKSFIFQKSFPEFSLMVGSISLVSNCLGIGFWYIFTVCDGTKWTFIPGFCSEESFVDWRPAVKHDWLKKTASWTCRGGNTGWRKNNRVVLWQWETLWLHADLQCIHYTQLCFSFLSLSQEMNKLWGQHHGRCMGLVFNWCSSMYRWC